MTALWHVWQQPDALKMAWHNRSPSFFPLKVCWYGKCRIDKSDCRRTVFTSKKKMPHVQVSFCFPGGHTVCLHRPTQGWTVGEYILLCKVSKLHPPSSLGLDGDGQILSRFEYMQEVPKEPTSPCSSIVFLVQPTDYHQRKETGNRP